MITASRAIDDDIIIHRRLQKKNLWEIWHVCMQWVPGSIFPALVIIIYVEPGYEAKNDSSLDLLCVLM